MAKVFIEENSLTAIGNAIRGKTGESALLSPAAMVTAIEGIETGGGSGNTDIEDKIITRNLSGEYTNNRITVVGDSAFQYCIGLTSVNLPNVTTLRNGAFNYCSNLTSINIPNLILVGMNTFQNTGFTTIALPKIQKIPSYCFSTCTRLTSADFAKVTTIESGGLNYCTNLVTLILRSETMCSLGSTYGLNATPIQKGIGYIYVPAALLETYKTATNWVTFAAQFRAIEDYPDICGQEVKMIVTEIITILGTEYQHTYSDKGYFIERDGIQYSDAVDPINSGRTYTETEEEVEEWRF